MKITFIANACCIFEHDDYRLLTDPWLVDGAFEGAWFHYPPLKTKARDLLDVDAIYVSHLHPDHYDPVALQEFAKARPDIPIVTLNHGGNFLHKLLRGLGFTNIQSATDGKSLQLGPFQLTFYAPFATHVFHESNVGNLIDSAMVVEAGGQIAINTNDNTPSLEAAHALRARHGRFTLAQLNYNAAGPFPSCFNNLSKEEKLRAHHNVLARNLEHLVALAKILEADYVMPFAGHYVIGGKQWPKNEYLGTTTWDAAAEYLREQIPGCRTLTLSEGLTFDLREGKITNGTYTPIDVKGMRRYIQDVLPGKPYSFESDGAKDDPALARWLREKLPRARQNLSSLQQRYDSFDRVMIYIEIPGGYFTFPYDKESFEWADAGVSFQQPYLVCTMDPRLLRRILLREAHWNNAEIGCHIDFIRIPDVYLPDLHTMLSFFCLSVQEAAQESKAAVAHA